MREMKKINWKDVTKRAGKTFAQAAGGAVVGLIANSDGGDIAVPTLVIAGVAAGISAVWNMALGYIKKQYGQEG